VSGAVGARLRVAVPPGRQAERGYAAAVVLQEQLGLEYDLEVEDRRDVALTLAGDPHRSVQMPDEFLGRLSEDEWLTPASVPGPPAWSREPSPLGAPRAADGLPVLFGAADGALAAVADDRVELAVDVFGSAVFMLGRYEEIARPVPDEHGRFRSDAAVATQGGFGERPLLDEYVELLRAAVNRVWPGLARPAPSTSLALSHDVDWPLCPARGRAGARTAAGDLVVRRDPGLAARRLVSLGPWGRRGRRRLDPCNTFELMMDAAEAAGVRSAFYFMAEGSHPLDGRYRLDDPWIVDLIARIAGRGHAVGLHPSYGTSDEPGLLGEELERLRGACQAAGVWPSRWGGRQHFLRWRAPSSWRAWADAGLDYDSSLGWSDTIGFRSGTCREHPVFDLERGRPLDLRERPLIVMEGALLQNGVVAHDLPDRVVAMGAAVASVGGEMSLLWHNSRLQEARDKQAFRRSVAGAVP
jgi:hypothetical protein